VQFVGAAHRISAHGSHADTARRINRNGIDRKLTAKFFIVRSNKTSPKMSKARAFRGTPTNDDRPAAYERTCRALHVIICRGTTRNDGRVHVRFGASTALHRNGCRTSATVDPASERFSNREIVGRRRIL
jgi:hypothetical protein